MRSNPKPGHWRSKALIALLAAIGALAGGTQALGPAPAVAMSELEGPCDNPNLDFWDWVAACVEGGGSGGGGQGSSGGGQGSGGGLPADDGREEVINVSDKRNCAEPGVICIQLGVTEGFSQPDDEDRTRLRETKEKVDREYVSCMKERKKFMLPGQRPLCPVYCSADGTYRSPLAKKKCGGGTLLPTPAMPPSLEAQKRWLSNCRVAEKVKKQLQRERIRLQDAGTWDSKAWADSGKAEREARARGVWNLAQCKDWYAEM